MKKLDERHDHVLTLKSGQQMCVQRQHFEVEPEDTGRTYHNFCGGGRHVGHLITVEDVGRKVSHDHVDALHSDWRFVNQSPNS